MNRRNLSGASGGIELAIRALDRREHDDARQCVKITALRLLADLGVTHREIIAVEAMIDRAETGGLSLYDQAHQSGEIRTEEPSR